MAPPPPEAAKAVTAPVVAHDRKEETEEEKKAKKKQRLLLNIRVESYADDVHVYKPRTTTEQRLEYWNYLVNQKQKRIPRFDSWVKKDQLNGEDQDLNFYHPRWIRLVNNITSPRWDTGYLYLFILFIAIVVLTSEDMAASIGLSPLLSPDLAASATLLPLVLMFLTQLVPFFGMIFCICVCNDITRHLAKKQCSDWAFVAVLVGQYVEYFYYGGKNKQHTAGHVRRTEEEMVEIQEKALDDADAPTMCSQMWHCFRSCGGLFGHATVFPEGYSQTEDQRSLAEGSSLVDGEDELLDRIRQVEDSEEWGDGMGGAGENLLLNDVVEDFAEEDEDDDEPRMLSDFLSNTAGASAASYSTKGPAFGALSTKNVGALRNSSSNLLGTPGTSTRPGTTNTRPNTGLSIKDAAPELAGDRKKSVKLAAPVATPSSSAGGQRGSVVAPPAGDEEQGLSATQQNELKLKKLEEEANHAAFLAAQEWSNWTCVVCGRKNRELRHPPEDTKIYFGTKGVYYKRTYAIITPRVDMPRCKFCDTLMNYTPPACSAHLFEHNTGHPGGFVDYPRAVVVHANLNPHVAYRTLNAVISFFFGVRHHYSSKLLYNDWRLPLYLASKFPDVARSSLLPGEFLEVGEIVECRVQKSDWNRARILAVHVNHTYNIQYDSMVDLRFVKESDIRLLPEKGPFAYRVELMMCMVVILFPLCLAAQLTGLPLLGLCILIPCAYLVSLRTYHSCLLFYRNYAAGCLHATGIYLLYSASLLVMVMAGIFIVTKAESSSWNFSAVLFIVVMASVLFIQTSTGAYFLAAQFDGAPLVPAAFSMIPLFTATCTLLGFRSLLNKIWDVQLRIRPPKGYTGEEESNFSKVVDFIKNLRSGGE